MVDFKPYYWNPDLTNLLARETYARPVNSQTQTQSNKKMSGLYNHFRIDVDIYKFIVILGEDAKNSTWGYPIFIRDQRIYRSFRLSVCRSVCPSVHNFWKFWNLNFSALVQDRDLGFSRGHQSDDEEEDEDDDDDEEVKDDKDDNEEAEEDDKEEEEDNYQTIKCLTFLESQAQAELNDDDDKDEEVKDDKDDNKEAEEDDKEEDEDNYQTIKCLTFSESQAQAK